MNIRIKKILTICYLFITSLASAKQYTLDDIHISWKDFKISSKFSSQESPAKLFYSFDYNAKLAVNKENYQVLKLRSDLRIARSKSWVSRTFIENASNEEKQELLDHHKGHYIIALIQFKKFRDSAAKITFSKYYQLEVDNLHSYFIQEGKILSELYDNQTNHMKIKNKQLEWIDFLLRQLNDLYAVKDALITEFKDNLSINTKK